MSWEVGEGGKNLYRELQTLEKRMQCYCCFSHFADIFFYNIVSYIFEACMYGTTTQYIFPRLFSSFTLLVIVDTQRLSRQQGGMSECEVAYECITK